MNLLTTNEAAERLGIDPSLVRFYCREGRIQGALRVGRDWAIPEDELKRFSAAPRPTGRPRIRPPKPPRPPRQPKPRYLLARYRYQNPDWDPFADWPPIP